MAELVLERQYFSPGLIVIRVINTIIWLIESLLVIRLILTLLGASSSAQFVSWYYDLTDKLVAPFAGAFPSLSLAGFTLETASVLAMIVYALIGWVFVRIISAAFTTY